MRAAPGDEDVGVQLADGREQAVQFTRVEDAGPVQFPGVGPGARQV
ncbi:hypothetical protein [Streptomyces sp. NBC_01803]|nr:hypothetical protein [Streptomyces sp. NBC_01803]WSA44048.1 hypothetical protein OIE51_07420 [Streptomyces sp. NBC_01803]